MSSSKPVYKSDASASVSNQHEHSSSTNQLDGKYSYDEMEQDETDDDDTDSEQEHDDDEDNIVESDQTIHLLEEILELQRRHPELRGLHEARVLNINQQDTMISFTLEYYHVFRHGCLVFGPKIMRFITKRTDPEYFVFGATPYGLEMLMEQWRRYTTLLPGIQLHLHSHELVPFHEAYGENDPKETASMVIANGSLSGLFSRQAVATILPHILYNEPLMEKLANKSLVVPLRLCFHFNTRGRVIRMDVETDFLHSFRAVDGITLIELATIMEHAVIDENSMVRDVVMA